MKSNRWKTGLVALTALLTTTSCPSSTLKEFTPQTYRPNVVEYSREATNKIGFLYHSITRPSTGTEFALCLEGRISNDTLYVEDVSLPVIAQATRKSVTWSKTSCDGPDYVGYLHSHPKTGVFTNCYLSLTDWRSFSARKEAYISALACGDGTIRTFTRPDSSGKKYLNDIFSDETNDKQQR